ncbi:MAG: hypothetical protein JWL90_3750, partial [Chthoniobacteraceae bacterium]|nr:hypothetical protein [Chthoniobacteraceae bacterium]
RITTITTTDLATMVQVIMDPATTGLHIPAASRFLSAEVTVDAVMAAMDMAVTVAIITGKSLIWRSPLGNSAREREGLAGFAEGNSLRSCGKRCFETGDWFIHRLGA